MWSLSIPESVFLNTPSELIIRKDLWSQLMIFNKGDMHVRMNLNIRVYIYI